MREWHNLKLDRDGILWRVTTVQGDVVRRQLVVPMELRRTVYHELHEEMGH